MDYKFLAGITLGLCITFPFIILGVYKVYRTVSNDTSKLANEFGRP
ncbi:protein 3a [Maize yellow dwarf virus RMV]|nr:protein 3a [Maize yellow dwarf virus RMV]